MKQRINQVPKIMGGIYFINNITPIIVGTDWIPLENFSEIISPNVYFSIENNKLKYTKGKTKLECDIFWSLSIKSESDFKIRFINNNTFSEISENAKITKVIGHKVHDKIILNDLFGIEISSEIQQEILISSAFIKISEI